MSKQNTEAERILKEHRRWTQWIVNPRAMRLGNLVLTNRRLIFLHKIQSSPEVNDNIKKLADAPIETVLNYAFTLNRDNFQIPLYAIGSVRIGTFKWNPFPHLCLTVIYFDGRQTRQKSASFQFIRPIKQTILHPQIAVDVGWIRALKQAIRNAVD
ncbi:MAG: hypothetical protein PHY28_07280 [Dehalococcoidales bacterium]|nr:hypothetical protein [Dehalococcoidales bacterium]